MNWYSTGSAEAEKLAASTQTRRTRNFFTKPGESARIRFLKPAAASFNYKRAFVTWAKGQKLLTSPGTAPDPFVERGLSLQAAFAWPILDKRTIEIKDRDSGEEKKIGPRVLFFADGQRTRKQLIAFERDMLDNVNEEREEEGKDPLTLEEFNLTSYDLKVSKDQKAPWNFIGTRPKELAKEENELIEKAQIDLSSHDWLARELAPLPSAELKILLENSPAPVKAAGSSDEAYSYDDNDDDTVSFSSD